MSTPLQTTSAIAADVGVTYAALDRWHWVLTGKLSRDGVFEDIVELAELPSQIRFVRNDVAAMN